LIETRKKPKINIFNNRSIEQQQQQQQQQTDWMMDEAGMALIQNRTQNGKNKEAIKFGVGGGA